MHVHRLSPPRAGDTVASLTAYDPDDTSYAGPAAADVVLTGSTLFDLVVQDHTVSVVVNGALSDGVSLSSENILIHVKAESHQSHILVVRPKLFVQKWHTV